MWVCGSPLADVGLAGFEMSQICTSPAQEATATRSLMNAWMSWQAWNGGFSAGPAPADKGG
jgi:hypothetical protein